MKGSKRRYSGSTLLYHFFYSCLIAIPLFSALILLGRIEKDLLEPMETPQVLTVINTNTPTVKSEKFANSATQVICWYNENKIDKFVTIDQLPELQGQYIWYCPNGERWEVGSISD